MNIFNVVALVLVGFGGLLGVLLGNLLHLLVLFHFFLAIILVLIAIRRGAKFEGSLTASGGGLAKLFKALGVIIFFLGLYALSRNAHLRWDSTEQKVYSLSSISEQVLSELSGSLAFYLIANKKTQEGTAVLDLVNRYRFANPEKVSVSMIDPKSNPQLARKYQLVPGDSMVIDYASLDGKVRTKKLATINERTVTSAIKSFSSDGLNVYVTQGKGEPGIDDTSEAGLSKFVTYAAEQSINLQGLYLSTVGSVPSNAKSLVIISPSSAFDDREYQLVKDYIDNGGNVFLLHDPEASNVVPQIALDLGVGVQKAVVLDQDNLMHSADPIGWQLFLRSFAPSEVTRPLGANRAAVFLVASPLRLIEEHNKNRRYKKLIESNSGSWGERDLTILQQIEPKAEFTPDLDLRGPFPMAVSVESSLGTRGLVFGDSQWLQNVNIDLFSHRELALSAVQWVSYSNSGLIPIPQVRFSYMPIGKRFYNLLLMLCYLVPELVIIIGLVLHHRRSQLWLSG